MRAFRRANFIGEETRRPRLAAGGEKEKATWLSHRWKVPL
jgi:hypothetical protein